MVHRALTMRMTPAAVFLLLAVSGSAPLVPDATVRPAARAEARASVRVLPTRRVREIVMRADTQPGPEVTVRRDAAGTVWAEFS